jgi:hypothetical protein
MPRSHRNPTRLAAVVGGALLAAASGGLAAPIDLPIDEYLCHQAKKSRLPVAPKFSGVEISSKDSFEQSPAGYRNYLAAKHVAICNPITTPASPTTRPDVHLVEYAIKESKAFPNATKFIAPLSLYNLADRLGMPAGSFLINKPKSVLVRSGKLDYGTIVKCKDGSVCSGGDECFAGVCLPPGNPLPAFPSDLSYTADYTCYSVKGPKVAYPNALAPPGPVADQLGYAQQYELKKITKLCAPTTKGVPNPGGPQSAPAFPPHLVCYQVKSLKTNPAKFLARTVAITDPMISAPTGVRWLDVKKQSEICVPAMKAVAPGVPGGAPPTTLTITNTPAGGQCGTITLDLPGEGVPNRLNPATGDNGNAACTGAGTPQACCEGAGSGHCDERTTITCGSLSFGGGGSPATIAFPGPELPQPDGRRRFALGCTSLVDPACTVSGHAGDLASGINCSNAGCGFLAPLDTTDPFKICGLVRLASPATGTLDLVSGAMTLDLSATISVNVGTFTSSPARGCPRCRTGVATTNPEVFSTGPTAPGVGVCDADSSNPGTSCYVFEPAGSTQGLSTDCTPSGGIAVVVPFSVSTTSGTTSVSDPAGRFCPGQAGAPDCLAAGVPNPCCTGPGTGPTCGNFNGCFGSANATGARFPDTPGVCTGISATGQPAGFLMAGLPPTEGVVVGQTCGAAVSAPPFTELVNGAFGLPSPIVATQKGLLEVN